MKLSFIAPIHYLKEVSVLGSIQFFLGHLFDHPVYRDYYNLCKDSGAYTMVDNGVVETGEPIDAEQLIKLAVDLRPSELIGPDYRDEADRTLRALEEFIPEFRDQCRGIKLMGVAHGKTFSEWIDSYKALTQMDVDVIGIPYRLCFGGPIHASHWAINRYKALKFIHSNLCSGIEYHCLGLNTLDELRTLSCHSWVRSCDSTFLFMQTAKHGVLFDPRSNLVKASTDSLDFECIVDDYTIKLIRTNAFYLKFLAGDTDPMILGGVDVDR